MCAIEIGIGLPQAGKLASPQNLLQIAQEAERLGYAAVWAYEHLLRPTYPVPGAMGGEPQMQSEAYGNTYDALTVLSYIAARTEHIKLGTSVINALFHPPLILARQFATLDQLSGGRAIAGLGQGWMEEEFVAVNVPMKRRGSGMEEYIRVLRAIWGPDPVSFTGRFYTIPEAEIGPKPVKPEGIPIIMGGFSPVTVGRAARLADGINPGAAMWSLLEHTMNSFRAAAREAGRTPEKLQVIVRVVELPFALPERQPFIGTVEEISDDLVRAQELGVDHVIFDLSLKEVPIREQLHFLEQLRVAVRV